MSQQDESAKRKMSDMIRPIGRNLLEMIRSIEFPRPDIKSILNTAGIAAAGCLIIILASPFVRIIAVQSALERSTAMLKKGKPQEAMTELRRYSLWAKDHPSVALTLSEEMVRCHMRMKSLQAAEKQSNLIFDRSLEDNSGDAIELVQSKESVLTVWPNKIANWIVSSAHGNSYDWKPTAGFEVMLEELEDMERHTELRLYAQLTLQKSPENQAALSTLAFLDMGNQAKRPGSKRPQPIREDAAEPVNPIAPLPPTKIKKPRAVAEQSDELPIGDVIYEMEPPPPPPRKVAVTTSSAPSSGSSNARKEYDNALSRYSAAKKEARKLEKEMNNATGSRRMEILEQLRKRKGHISRLEAEVEAAKARL